MPDVLSLVSVAYFLWERKIQSPEEKGNNWDHGLHIILIIASHQAPAFPSYAAP